MAPWISRAAFLAGLAAILALAASPASASCKLGICASGSQPIGSSTHTVVLTNSLPGFTHYTVITPGRAQFELDRNVFTFKALPGKVYVYSVQACSRHGFSRSKCTPWAQFRFGVPITG
jgi:hypothetical protein